MSKTNTQSEAERKLWQMSNSQIRELCKERGLKNYFRLSKRKLVELLLKNETDKPDSEIRKYYQELFNFNEFLGIQDKLPK